MSDKHFDFDGLNAVLADERNLRDHSRRLAVLQRYKGEIATLLIRLRGAKVIGRNEGPMDPASNCDQCGKALEPDALYVDGMINDGSFMWSNMCVHCFMIRGAGIGWGVGQLYSHNGDHWHCIGGGNPQPPGDDGES